MCNARTLCVSFEHSKNGTDCQLSSSCTFALSVKQSGDKMNLYVKKAGTHLHSHSNSSGKGKGVAPHGTAQHRIEIHCITWHSTHICL